MKFFGLSFICLFTFSLVFSQEKAGAEKSLDLSSCFAKFQGTASLSYHQQWFIRKEGKFSIGTGVRFTSYLSANQYYITAPAKLTSGTTGPQVFFIENIKVNMDTFLVKSPRVHALNLLLNLNYQFSEKFSLGFNIDVIGFSFGKQVRGNYINGFEGANLSAKPTSFNLLLVSDNDLGTLNSELYGTYSIHSHWSIKGIMQFLFTEYTTEREVQQFPESNDRFRRKSLLFGLGIIRKL